MRELRLWRRLLIGFGRRLRRLGLSHWGFARDGIKGPVVHGACLPKQMLLEGEGSFIFVMEKNNDVTACVIRE